MRNEAESLMWFMGFIAHSALHRSDLSKIVLGTLNKTDFLTRLKQEPADDADVKIIFEHFDSFIRLAEKAQQGKRQ